MGKWTEQTDGQVKGAGVAKWTANKGAKWEVLRSHDNQMSGTSSSGTACFH